MFYNDHGIADLIIEMSHSIPPDGSILNVGNLKIRRPTKPSELHDYIHVETLSGRILKCYIKTTYINECEVLYEDYDR